MWLIIHPSLTTKLSLLPFDEFLKWSKCWSQPNSLCSLLPLSPFQFLPSSPLVSKPFWFSNLANQGNFDLQLYNCCKALQSAGMPSRGFTAVKMQKRLSFSTTGLLLEMQPSVLSALIYWREKQCENTVRLLQPLRYETDPFLYIMLRKSAGIQKAVN